MKFRNRLNRLMMHGGIILACCMLLLSVSCKEEPEPVEPDPVGDFFKELQTGIDLAGAESITVIAVDDNVGAGMDLQRQVFQEIQTQLRKLESVAIIEHPTPDLELKFSSYGITPGEGISPSNAIDLATDLGADTLLYASIESKTPDVHIKVYAGGTGAIVFAETLQEWPLPVSRETADPPDLLEESGDTADLGDSESSGQVSGDGL